ncbi:MAG: hypothetical protein PHG40_02760, partial [Candidatus Omnitrophica bacterium]|nr:hypothetical protein [Candidatus Omnitrophota bacterium]
TAGLARIIRNVKMLNACLKEYIKDDSDPTKDRGLATIYRLFREEVAAQALKFGIPASAFDVTWRGEYGIRDDSPTDIWDQLYPHLARLQSAKMDSVNLQPAFQKLFGDYADMAEDCIKRRKTPEIQRTYSAVRLREALNMGKLDLRRGEFAQGPMESEEISDDAYLDLAPEEEYIILNGARFAVHKKHNYYWIEGGGMPTAISGQPPSGPGEADAKVSPALWSRAGTLPVDLQGADVESGAYSGDNRSTRFDLAGIDRIRQELSRQAPGSQHAVINGTDYRFTQVSQGGVSFLVEQSIASQGTLGSLLRQALDGLPQGLDTTRPYLILPAAHIIGEDHQDHLAGDCIQNGVIFLHNNLNERLATLNSTNPLFATTLLRVLLAHELRHEATGRHGAQAEQDFQAKDIQLICELLDQEQLVPFAEALIRARIIYRGSDFDKQLTASLERRFSHVILSDGFRTAFESSDVHVRGISPDPRIIRNYIDALKVHKADGGLAVPKVLRVYIPYLRLDLEASQAQRKVVTRQKIESELPNETVQLLNEAAKEGLFEVIELRSEQDYRRFAQDLRLPVEEPFEMLIQSSLMVFVSEWVGSNVRDTLSRNRENNALLSRVGKYLGETLLALHKAKLIAGDTHLGQFVVRGDGEEVMRVDLNNIYSLRETSQDNIAIEHREIYSRLRPYPAALTAFLSAYPLPDERGGSSSGAPEGQADGPNTAGDKKAETLGGIDGSTSLTIDSRQGKIGGIDFRRMPILTQPVINQGRSAYNAGASPILKDDFQKQGQSPAGTDPMGLAQEWQEIQRMLAADITPSSQRIKQYLQDACKSGCIDKEIGRVISCIAEILRMEEERSCATEAALKEILTLLEKGPYPELSVVLSRINVMPGEPVVIR